MGVISTVKNYLAKRRIERNTKEVMDTFDSDFKELVGSIEFDPEVRKAKREKLLTDLALKVKSGEIDLGGTEEERKNDSLAVLENYFLDNLRILSIIENIRGQRVIAEMMNEFYSDTPNLAQVEEKVVAFMRKYRPDGRNPNISPYTSVDKFGMMIDIIEEYNTDPDLAYDQKYLVRSAYENDTIRRINEAKGPAAKLRIYDEYISQFLFGDIQEQDVVIKQFADEEFAKNRVDPIEVEMKRIYGDEATVREIEEK